MPVHVSYDPDCDQNFRRLYHNQFQQWMNANHRFTIHDGATVDFDQAHVLNGLHPTTSTHDPNPTPHVTVRLSTPSLRSQGMWYILHWRVGNGSVLLPQPDNEESNRRRQIRRREKKQRRQERDRNIRAIREGVSAGSHGSGAGDSSRGADFPQGTAPPRRNGPSRGNGPPHGSDPTRRGGHS